MARLWWFQGAWRGHRAALLTCVMAVATAVALLQYLTCNYTNSASLLHISSSDLVAAHHSTLSKLDVLSSSENGPHNTILTQNGTFEDNSTGAASFKAPEIGGVKTTVNTTGAMRLPEDVEEKGLTGDSVVRDSGGDELQVFVLHHTPSELVAPAPNVEEELMMAHMSLEKLSPIATTADHADQVIVEVQGDDSNVSQEIKDQLVQRENSTTSQEIRDRLVQREDSTMSQEIKESPSPLPESKVKRDESSTASQEIKEISPLPQASPEPKVQREEAKEISSQPSPQPKEGPIFQELQACKKAINDATPDCVDPSLYSGVYKNVTAFSKSYELMEKVFKVYTYRDGRPPLVHTGPVEGIYASEGQFIERLKHAPQFHTRDPARAHMFFLSYSVQHMVRDLYVPDSHTMLPLATFIKEYVEGVARRYPFWNRSQGADHFFVSCHDWGPATARDHPELRTNATKVVCNADLTEEFLPHKDASLPEVYLHYTPKRHRKTPPLPPLGGPGWNERPFLAFFAGQMHGRVRPILLKHWRNTPHPEMQIYELLPENLSYTNMMKMSKYCVCAAGFEVNSPRIVEAIYHDCVPVIIADHFVLPFSEVLDWGAFSITVSESEIWRLREVLSAVSEQRWQAMQRGVRSVRRHFLWGDRGERFDCFHMVLHSVWMSRLRRIEEIREVSTGELF